MLLRAVLNMCNVRILKNWPPVMRAKIREGSGHIAPGTSVQNIHQWRPTYWQESVCIHLNVRKCHFSLSFSAGPFDSIHKLWTGPGPLLQQLHFQESILLQWFSNCGPCGTLGCHTGVLLVLQTWIWMPEAFNLDLNVLRLTNKPTLRPSPTDRLLTS